MINIGTLNRKNHKMNIEDLRKNANNILYFLETFIIDLAIYNENNTLYQYDNNEILNKFQYFHTILVILMDSIEEKDFTMRSLLNNIYNEKEKQELKKLVKDKATKAGLIFDEIELLIS